MWDSVESGIFTLAACSGCRLYTVEKRRLTSGRPVPIQIFLVIEYPVIKDDMVP